MEFVNGIAKIVHMEVSLHGGAPNKNIGDAFLLVWKLPKGFTAEDILRPTTDFKPKLAQHDVGNASLGFGPIREPVGFGPIRDPVKMFDRRPSKVVSVHAHGEQSFSRRTSFANFPPAASPQDSGPSFSLLKTLPLPKFLTDWIQIGRLDYAIV